MSKILSMVTGDSLLEEDEEFDEETQDENKTPNTTIKRDGANNEQQGNETWLIGGILGGKNTFLQFRCSALADRPENPPAYTLHMTYKTIQAETKLLAALLGAHGLREVHPNIPDFNLLWTGIHPKPDLLRAMTPYQRVNHFPRSYELTRKDRLYKNIEKMQHLKGFKNFDFIPQTFVMPTDFRELCSAHYRQRGPWIVKPVASSRGRGIFIVSTPEQVPLEESVIVAKYIDNPLLIDGHKCDLRLYVAVTSYHPLRIYLYEEGLVRFATVKYDTSGKHLWNPCMHLCNYSINKYHSDYVKSDDPEAENIGHKWTLSALLRHLRSEGHDTGTLMQSIEELVVKSILASAPQIVAACKLFVPHSTNCFELYGFDILIDSNFKPWLLEVNLSPSLGCDSPLDIRVKSAMLSDLLNLVGVPAVDPMLRRANEPPSNNKTNNSYSQELLKRLNNCRRVQSADTLPRSKGNSNNRLSVSSSSLTPEESRLVRISRGEYERRGGFVRIFPSAESWRRYGSFLDPNTGITSSAAPLGSFTFIGPTHNLNLMLQRQLFPETHDTLNIKTQDRLGRYERALLRGHRSPLETDKGCLENAAEDAQQVGALKEQVRQSLENGKKLSQNQSRRTFGIYLGAILRRLALPLSLSSCEEHSELILRYLQKASYNLRTPYFVKVPSRKLAGKDRIAVIAKQLNDFIYLYNRETDLFVEQTEAPHHVDGELFQRFLIVANETELEEILTLQTRLYKCAHLYLIGRNVQTPIIQDLRTVGLLRSLTDLNNYNECECMKKCQRQSLPRLTRRSPINTRNLSHYKSRSLDSSTPTSQQEEQYENKQPTPPPPTILIKPCNKTKLNTSKSCTFRSTEKSIMKKSISLQEHCYKKARNNEDDINFLNINSASTTTQQQKVHHSRSLSNDKQKSVDSSPTRRINQRSLPRLLVGAFRTKEEEEAAVRRLLQPLRSTSSMPNR